jgi:broad specificity phosphatase PhoE
MAARWLAATMPPDLVVTSDLLRSQQTAARIVEEVGVASEAEARLRERDAGEWTGLMRDEIEARWPGWLADRRRPPGFEDDAALLARVLPALTELTARGPADGGSGDRILVVTHGGVVRTVERHLGSESPPLPNLAAREVVVSGAEWLLGRRMLLLPGPGEGDGLVTVPAEI